MKLLKYAKYAVMATVVVVGLGACSKKKNGSVAATPASVCSWNGSQYVNTLGQQCSPTATSVCPATGINPSTGQQCVPGQAMYPISQGYQGQYGYQQYPQQAMGCNQWTMMYGIQYVPVNLYGQYQCVRIDLLQPYTLNTGYQQYGYDYYYAYPPRSGSGCNTQVDFGGSWGYVGICF